MRFVSWIMLVLTFLAGGWLALFPDHQIRRFKRRMAQGNNRFFEQRTLRSNPRLYDPRAFRQRGLILMTLAVAGAGFVLAIDQF